jgi:spore coat polysaccharide biosynthesis predicted glycosyltransferase SpsG
MKQSVLLYADAGPGAGMGHIFRQYPLFQEMKSIGIPAKLFISLPEKQLATLGLVDVCGISDDQQEIQRVFSRSSSTAVVLDSYKYTNPICRLIRQQSNSRIAVFDDHYTLVEKTDILINTSPSVEATKYQKEIAKVFLFGPPYSPISSAFMDARKKYIVRPSIQRILVGLGGDDVQNNLGTLLNVLGKNSNNDFSIDVLGGRIPSKASKYVNILGWVEQPELASRLSDYDLAILAGGSMLHQFACVGLPVISWPQTANQKRHASAWQAKGAVTILEDPSKLPALYTRLQNGAVRQGMFKASRKTVDGKGIERIVSKLLSQQL